MGIKKEKYIVQVQNLLNEQVGKLFYMTQNRFSENCDFDTVSFLEPAERFMLCDIYSVFNNTQEPLTDEANMLVLKVLEGTDIHFLWFHYKEFHISDNGMVRCNSFKRLG